MWGEDKETKHKLGGPHGDLALICQWLTSLACIANNVYHLWLNTTINSGTIIPYHTLQYLLPGVRDILQLSQRMKPLSIYASPSTPDTIKSIVSNKISAKIPQILFPPTLMTLLFNGIVISFLMGDHSTDDTGIDNNIFAAFGLYTFAHTDHTWHTQKTNTFPCPILSASVLPDEQQY